MSPRPLHQLKKGQTAHIHTIDANPLFGTLDATVAQRLADLGFCHGTALTVIATGLMGKGPFAVRLGNHAQFSLRQAEAAKIICLPHDSQTA